MLRTMKRLMALSLATSTPDASQRTRRTYKSGIMLHWVEEHHADPALRPQQQPPCHNSRGRGRAWSVRCCASSSSSWLLAPRRKREVVAVRGAIEQLATPLQTLHLPMQIARQ